MKSEHRTFTTLGKSFVHCRTAGEIELAKNDARQFTTQCCKLTAGLRSALFSFIAMVHASK